MTATKIPMFPRPPRQLSRCEKRGTAVVVGLGLVVLSIATIATPAMQREERLAQHRAEVWRNGIVIEGIIEAKHRSPLGRKVVYYRYQVEGKLYDDERVITPVDSFDEFEVGRPVSLRIDPEAPEFSVLAVDVVPSFEDWIPSEALGTVVFVAGGLIALWGFHRRRILCDGIEVPCAVQAASLPNFVRVTYTWQGVTRTRRVEGQGSPNGEATAVLLNPNWPAWPVLAQRDRFASEEDQVSASLDDLRRRWAEAMLPGVIGGWITWGMLSLLTGEAVSPHVRTVCAIVVGLVLTFISGRSRSDSPKPFDSGRG